MQDVCSYSGTFSRMVEKMMSRIDVKMKSSKELRELRTMIRKELDFRAEIGEELEDGRIKEWVSAVEYSARIQKEKEVKKNDETEKNSERS